MSQDNSHWLHHPEHGELPAAKLVDCVFALAPNGRILHFHVEQVTAEARGSEHHYLLGDAAPLPERARCQVIPPFVNAFPRRADKAG